MTDETPNEPNNIEEQIHRLRSVLTTRQQFSTLLQLLYEDYKQNGSEWENDSLDRYLEAMSAWLADSDAYYASRGVEVDLDQPSWRVLADILLAARVYE